MAASTTTTITASTQPQSQLTQPQHAASEQDAASNQHQQVNAGTGEAGPSGTQETERITLRLRPRRKKGVKWTEETIDNEHLGKKSSKKCCIFHKQQAWGDWSDDDDDDDSSASGNDSNSESIHGECHHCGKDTERNQQNSPSSEAVAKGQ